MDTSLRQKLIDAVHKAQEEFILEIKQDFKKTINEIRKMNMNEDNYIDTGDETGTGIVIEEAWRNTKNTELSVTWTNPQGICVKMNK